MVLLGAKADVLVGWTESLELADDVNTVDSDNDGRIELDMMLLDGFTLEVIREVDITGRLSVAVIDTVVAPEEKKEGLDSTAVRLAEGGDENEGAAVVGFSLSNNDLVVITGTTVAVKLPANKKLK